MNDYVNEYIARHEKITRYSLGEHKELTPRMTCKDGLVMSVQASEYHYCAPRENRGPYEKVEIGFPSQMIDEIMEYAEDDDQPTNTVYGWVPVEVVNAVIEKHGGLA